jgi:hypothetical protein
MYIFWYQGLMSTYYYYKIYYNLWLCGFLLAVMALHILSEKKHMVLFYSYFTLMLGMAYLSVSDYDALLEEQDETMNESYATSRLFPLYHENAEAFRTDYEESYKLPDYILDICSYVADQTGEEYVPMIAEAGDWRYWLDGMKGVAVQIGIIINNAQTIEEQLYLLDIAGAQKIVVVKTDENYELYQEYYDRCNVIYDNGNAALISCPGNTWSELLTVQ